jgi:hypothetical protein
LLLSGWYSWAIRGRPGYKSLLEVGFPVWGFSLFSLQPSARIVYCLPHTSQFIFHKSHDHLTLHNLGSWKKRCSRNW